jgi:hypothetical protein
MARALSSQGDNPVGARLARVDTPKPAGQDPESPQQAQARIVGDITSLMGTHDPLREVVSPSYKETVSLELKDATLDQALDAIHTASGFIVLADEGLQAAISIPKQDIDVEQAIDQIATAAHAKWRRVYLVTKPQPQSEADLEKRMDDGFEKALTDFWSKSPDDRAQIVAEIARQLNSLPPEAATIARSLPFASHIVGKLITYNAGLDAGRRQEIAPAVHAAIRLLGGEG